MPKLHLPCQPNVIEISDDILPSERLAFQLGVKYFEEPASACPVCNRGPNQGEHILQHSC